MKIRKATLKDLKEVDEIYVEGSIDEGKLQFPNVSKKEMIKDLDKHKKERIRGFRKDINSKKDYWVVAELNGVIGGFGQAQIKDYKYDGNYAEIDKIYVKKGFRKKGIAKKIVNELIKWLKKKGIKAVGARIYYKNKPSIKLNESLGFKLMAVRMEKKLK